MRIVLRTSGGRGEYELAGEQDGTSASELFDRRIALRISPDLVLDSHSTARRMQGKPRIRVDSQSPARACRVLADTPLLPVPRRELRQASDSPDFVRDQQYSITNIDVDISSMSAGEVELRPKRLWLSNAIGLVRGVDLAA